MPSKATSTKDVLVSAAVVLALGAAGLVMTWGHPWSNWYYAFILVLLIVIAVPLAIFLGWQRDSRVPANPPRSKESALVFAAISFLLSAAFFYLFMVLTLGAKYQWPVGAAMGLGNGINQYRSSRGMPYSNRPMFIVWGILMAGLAVFAVVKLVHKGVIKF